MSKLSPATIYLLKSFMPYSKESFLLGFKPATFFYELERKSQVKERTLRSAYYRAIKSGLLIIDDTGKPRLTDNGRAKLRPYKPKSLGKHAKLLVAFDIPESERTKRSHLRALLHELSFKKIQQSVWATNLDCREYLAAEISDNGLEKYVAIFEAVELKT